MNCVLQDLGNEPRNITIEIFSDLHIGSTKCDYDEIIRRVKLVEEDPNKYCVILGDVVNNTTKTSVGDVYEEPVSPMNQIKKAVDIFRPIKDKILGVTTGNHERRTYKQDGIDLGYFFCRELGIEDCYDYAGVVIFVRFGKKIHANSYRTRKDGTKPLHRERGTNCGAITYSMYITHGDGGCGRTVGGKMNALSRRGDMIDTDIVVMGHTHLPATFRECSWKTDNIHKCITQHEQVFVNASATLDHEEYAEIYGMAPSSKRSPVIGLRGDKYEIAVQI